MVFILVLQSSQSIPLLGPFALALSGQIPANQKFEGKNPPGPARRAKRRYSVRFCWAYLKLASYSPPGPGSQSRIFLEIMNGRPRIVINTLFYVAMAFLLITMFQIGRYEEGPPENLRNASYRLKLHYAEDLEDPKKSKLWHDLDIQLESYASALELRRRDFRIQYWSALIFYPFLALMLNFAGQSESLARRPG